MKIVQHKNLKSLEIVLVHTANEEIFIQGNRLSLRKNPATYRKDHTRLPNEIYPRKVRLAQCKKPITVIIPYYQNKGGKNIDLEESI